MAHNDALVTAARTIVRLGLQDDTESDAIDVLHALERQSRDVVADHVTHDGLRAMWLEDDVLTVWTRVA